MPRVTPSTSQTYTVAGIEGPDGSDRIHITTAFVPAQWAGDYSALIGPALPAGEFRRATAMAGLAGFRLRQEAPLMGETSRGFDFWLEITDIEADWDDESGQVELRYTIAGAAGERRLNSEVTRIAVQVVTFAGPAA